MLESSRRFFITKCALSTLASQLPFDIFAQSTEGFEAPLSIMPINHLRQANEHENITGDQPHSAHKALWNVPALRAKLKQDQIKVERHSLVIIGAGVAGLTSAFMLSEENPILLEQASQLGGNAKGELWHEIPYALGAAYMVQPDPESSIDRLLKAINAYPKLKSSHLPPLSFLDGLSLQNIELEDANTNQAEVRSWQKLKKILRGYFESDGYVFPDMPTDDPQMRNYVNTLDQIDFKSFLEKQIEDPLPLRIQIYLEQYFWSSFGASMSEISAAAGINFLASETGELLVGPGGNAWITECLSREILKRSTSQQIRIQSLVYSVERLGKQVRVDYFDKDNKPRAILADRVIMACPKFVVKKILKDLPPRKLEAINKLKYRAYIVGNALIEGNLSKEFYEIYNLSKSSIDPNHKTYDLVTDIVYGNFAQISADRCVLSLYHPLPYDAGRAKVYSDLDLRSFRSKMTELLAQTLPQLGLKQEQLKGLRLTRWGHPLPVSSPKLMSEGIVDELRAPIGDQIYFAQQDNWALPAIETAMLEALWSAKLIKASKL